MIKCMNKKNPICAILWQDASFSNNNTLPKALPKPTLTVGYIVERNNEFTNISHNVEFKGEKIIPKDGFLIPNSSIINFQKIGHYEK